MSAGHSHPIFAASFVAVTSQIIMSIITIPLIGVQGAALARALAYTIMFLYPAYKLQKTFGIYYDRRALRIGLVGSVIMALTIFALDYILIHAYYLPFSLLAGFSTYLFFLRFTKAMKIQDFEIMNDALSHKWTTPIRLLAKVVIHGH